MKKLTALLLSLFLLTGCAGQGEAGYLQISQEDARSQMASETDYRIVDVRTPGEYAEGHIPGALNIPNESIGKEAPAGLPQKDQLIFIYCRSGNRSKQAAGKLSDLGYTNIREFGGINTWEGPVISGENP